MMEPLALYIHWPFCLAKCPYCDFNSHVRERIDQARFARALRAELAWEAARLGRRTLGSIFFGGGTPSLMAPDTVADLIADAHPAVRTAAGLRDHAGGQPDQRGGRAARGVSRRRCEPRVARRAEPRASPTCARSAAQHSAAQAIAALELARGLFPRVSFDLIYARPGQIARRVARRTARGAGARRRTTSRCTSSPSSRAPSSRAATDAARSCCPRPTTRQRSTKPLPRRRPGSGCSRTKSATTPGDGRGEPAQSRLLALWRLRGDRPRRAWTSLAGRRAAGDAPPSRARTVGRAGRTRRPRLHRRGGARPRDAGTRDAADGPAALRGHRREAIS